MKFFQSVLTKKVQKLFALVLLFCLLIQSSVFIKLNTKEAFAIGNDEYTVLLIHSDDTPGSNSFIDSSASSHIISSNSVTHSNAVTHAGFGATTISFGAANTNLTIPDSDDWFFGNNDFAIDFWIYFEGYSSANTYTLFGQFQDALNNWSMGLNNDTLKFSVMDDGSQTINIQYSWMPMDNNWHHFALTRNNNAFRVFIDGYQLETEVVNSYPMPNLIAPADLTFSGFSSDFIGFMDEIRVSKNNARWTTNFIPPTAPYSTPTCASGVCEYMPPTDKLPQNAYAPANSGQILIGEFELASGSGNILKEVQVNLVDYYALSLSALDFGVLNLWRDGPVAGFEGDETPIAGEGSGCPAYIGTNYLNADCSTTYLSDSIDADGIKYFITLSTGTDWSDNIGVASFPDAITFEVYDNGIITDDAGFMNSALFSTNSLSADTTGPKITGVSKVGDQSLDIYFNEPLDLASANNIANYNLTNGINPETISSINIFGNNDSVRVVTSNSISRNHKIALNSNIKDKFGNFTNDTIPRYIDPPILISEIQTYGEGDFYSEDEFVELYNRDGFDIDLTGYYLKDDNDVFIHEIVSGTTVIPANGFFLLANSNFNAPVANNYNGTKDQIFNGDILIDTGGSVTLFDNYGAIVDRVGYGFSKYFEGSPAFEPMPNESIERKAFEDSDDISMDFGGLHENLGNSFDSSNNEFDFVFRANPDPQNTLSNIEIPKKSGVIFTDPPSEQSSVPIGINPIYVAFEKAMDSATINPDNLYLTDGTQTTKFGSAYEANVVYCPDNQFDQMCMNGPLNFDYLAYISPPAGYLDYETAYEIIVSKNTLDSDGMPINGNLGNDYFSSIFYTENSINKNLYPPFVEGVIPFSGNFNVPTNSLLFAKFSQPMDASSFVANSANDTVQLVKVINPDTSSEYEGSKISINISVDQERGFLKVTPSALLEKNTRYRFKLYGNIKSSDGIEMDMDEFNNNLVWASDFHTVNIAGDGKDMNQPIIDFVLPEDGSTNIPTIPGVIEVFASKPLDFETINENSVILRDFLTLQEIAVIFDYEPFSNSIQIIPQEILSTSTKYEILLKDIIKDFTFPGNNLNAYQSTFTTSDTNDNTIPAIFSAWANEYKIEVAFNTLMNTDPEGINSVKNKNNIALKENGANIDLTNANIFYDYFNNSLIIDGLSLTAGSEFWISFYNGYNNADQRFGSTNPAGEVKGANEIPLGNDEDFYHTISGIISDSGSNNTTGNNNNYDQNDFGYIPDAIVFPFNSMASQKSNYHFGIPISKTILGGGKIFLKFPSGFDISEAQKDIQSPFNEDFNGPSKGFPQFDNTNGIAIDNITNSIIVTLENNPADTKNGCGINNICSTDPFGYDYLNFNIDKIINTNIPKSWDSDGYKIEIQTRDNNNNTLENITSQPFFIDPAGAFSLSGEILALGANSGQMKVFLSSPVAGLIETTTSPFASGKANYNFQNLSAGEYIIFTDSFVSLPDGDFMGINPPKFINIKNDIINYDLTINPENAGIKTEFTVDVKGFANETLNVFASSNENNIVKELILDNSGNGSVKFYLTNNEWFIGVASLNNQFSSFLIPKPKTAKIVNPNCEIDGVIGCQTNFDLKIPDKKLAGKVVDENNKPILNAQVFAHDPINGQEIFTKTDTNGDFELNLTSGKFKVGAVMAGLPASKEISVDILNDGTILVDGIQKNSVILMLKSTNYFISGSVLDFNGSAIKNASIWANRLDKPGFVETITDSMGKYKIFVTPGTWQIGVYLPNYGEFPSKNVIVTDASRTGINFSLLNTTETYRKISGNVSVGAENIANTFIHAEVLINGKYRMFDTITDKEGNYSMNVIENNPVEGKYSIYAYHPTFGDFKTITNLDVNADITGQNFSKPAPKNITVEIRDSDGNLKQINNAFIDFYDPINNFGNHLYIQNSNYGSLKLPNGNYEIYINIPGINTADITKTINDVVVDILNVADDLTLKINLPKLYNLSGKTNYNSVGMNDVWVEISNTNSGIQFGTSSDANGNYALDIPAGTYNIYAIKPGYFTATETITITNANVIKNLNLTKTNITIEGTILANNEIAPYAFVSAHKVGENVVLSTQADANGDYVLPIATGRWNLYATANGFKKTAHPNNTFLINNNQNGINFNLTETVTTGNPFSFPLIHSQGGIVNASNLGVLLSIPSNALGLSNSTGSVTIIDTTNLMQSLASQPFGNLGKQITALDENGKAIKNLNSPITIEIKYSKEQLDAIFAELGITPNLEVIKAIRFSYWNETAGTWLELPTTVITNPKNATTYADLVNNAEGFAVKIKAITTHLSIFSTVVSTVVTASATPGTGGGGATGGTSSGGGGILPSSLLSGIQQSIKRVANVIGETGQSIQVASGLNLNEVVVIKRNGKSVFVSDILNTAVSGASAKTGTLVAFAIGDVISTTSKGEADIDFGGFTKMHLGRNSEVKILDITKDKIKYEQNAGEIKYEFDNQGEKIIFEVHTVSVNATIRGTTIIVRTIDNQEVYDLIKGQIEMHDKKTGNKYDIIAGQRFQVDENGEITITEFNIDSDEFVDFLTQEQKEQIKIERENILQTGFRDVGEEDWFAPYAKKLYEMEIIQGRVGKLFAPNDPITRAEALKITLLVNNIEIENYDRKYRFYDIHEIDWFADFVSTAKKLNIVEGKSDGRFYPNNEITRAEALKIILETKNENIEIELNESCLFSDTAENDWHAKYICHASGEKIIQGYVGNLFKPNNSITRAEFAKMISVANNL